MNPFDDFPEPASSNPFDLDNVSSSPVKIAPKSALLNKPNSALASSPSPRATEKTTPAPEPPAPKPVETPQQQWEVSEYGIRVVDYEVVGSYCLFYIEVGQYGVIQILKRRFSEIDKFHTKLGVNIPGPPKHSMNASLSDSFLKQRILELNTYFSQLIREPSITSHPVFAEFFQLESLQEKKSEAFFLQHMALKTAHAQLQSTEKERDELKIAHETAVKLTQDLSTKLSLLEEAYADLTQRHEALTEQQRQTQANLYNRETQLKGILSQLSDILATNKESEPTGFGQ